MPSLKLIPLTVSCILALSAHGIAQSDFKEELNLKRQGVSQLAPEMTFGELAARFLAEADSYSSRIHTDS